MHQHVPFSLPQRPLIRQLRPVDAPPSRLVERSQALRGFEPQFTDIVDYIVQITDEIWDQRGIGRIYDTYARDCAIYSSYGIVTSVDDVVDGTVATLNAFPDGKLSHLNVAWSGDEEAGFFTSHLGFARSTNVGRTSWGPGTGRRTARHFVADCVSKDNLIHTEWLVRDNGVSVRELGFEMHALARQIAETLPDDHFAAGAKASTAVGLADPAEAAHDSAAGWVASMFDRIWRAKRLDELDQYYVADAIVHAAGGREVRGLRAIQSLIIHIMTAIPDATLRLFHVCHADEGDGVIVAVRWTLEGTSAPGGVIGECPVGRPVTMMASSHFRFQNGKIVEEWMVFDELAMLAQTYRA